MKKTKANSSKSLKLQAFRFNFLAASIAVLSAVPSVSRGLGLGEIQNHSWLGEPLSAQIDIINLPEDVNMDSLIVRHVDRKKAEEMGVEIISNWHNYQFDFNPDKLTYQVNIQSRRPVKEPYLNMLVELVWPRGKVYREYTLFLDPAPILSETTAKTGSYKEQGGGLGDAGEGRLREVETSSYRVNSGDTLYQIAHNIGELNGLGLQENVDWIFAHNRHAFVSDNINRLIAGKVISLPGQQDSAVQASQIAQKSTSVSESRKGLLFLDSPSVVEGESALALLSSGEGADLQQQLSNSRAVLDYLIKENRDLKDRVNYLESSEYLATIKQLLELQKVEIAGLRADRGSSLVNESKPIRVQAEPQLEAAVLAHAGAASNRGFLKFETLGSVMGESSEKVKPLTFWTVLFGGIAALFSALMLFMGRKTVKPSSKPVYSGAVAGDEARDGLDDRDIVVDELQDITLALGHKNTLGPREESAENELNLVAESNIALKIYREENEIIQNPPSIDEGLNTIGLKNQGQQAVEKSLDEVKGSRELEKELEKVNYLRESIKEKTRDYDQRKHKSSSEAQHVEEIEVDLEMEEYLKF